MWLINTHNGIKEKGIKPINIDDYPAVKGHLNKFYKELDKRQDKGITPYNLRNCAYMDDFNRQKIMYPNMTKFLPFYLDDLGFIQNDKSFMITGKHLEYLTAFLNSSLFKFCFLENFPELLGDTREIRKVFLDKIPVKQISDDLNQKFSFLVYELQKLKLENKDTKEIELNIDEHIFNLYLLSEQEKQAIGFIEIQ